MIICDTLRQARLAARRIAKEEAGLVTITAQAYRGRIRFLALRPGETLSLKPSEADDILTVRPDGTDYLPPLED